MNLILPKEMVLQIEQALQVQENALTRQAARAMVFTVRKATEEAAEAVKAVRVLIAGQREDAERNL